MLKKIIEKFKGDRKYFSIVFFVLITLAGSGIVTDYYLNKTRNNWNNILTSKINNLEKAITVDFNEKQNKLLRNLEVVRYDLRKELQPENESYKELVKQINDDKFNKYSIEVFAPNGKLIAWNQLIAINQDELFPLSFPLNQTYFLQKDLITYFSIVDTAHIQYDVFYIAISTPIEQNYKINNQYNEEVSFKNFLSEKYDQEISVDYSPYYDKTRDGRKFSFELINNFNNKIGLVTFNKPYLSAEINLIKEFSTKIQSILVIIALIFVGLGLKADYKKLKSNTFKIILLIFYLSIIRAALFVVGIPSNYIVSPLTDPSNFSSPFGFGIVKSPAEFFITVLFVAVISIQLYRYSKKSLHGFSFKYKIIGHITSAFIAVLIFLIIRGFGAAVKSIVFDSTIRYFKEPNIIPDLASLMMNLNLLFLGFSAVLVIVALMNFIIILNGIDIKNGFSLRYLIFLLVLSVIVFISFFLSNDPLVTKGMLLVFLLLICLLHIQVILKKAESTYNYLFVLLVGSVLSISLLNYFNTQLERTSLKTTAFELNRTDSNFLSFMLEETLRNIKNDEQITNSFGSRNANYDALAFIIWGKSAMQRESLNSGIRIYDKSKNLLGEFSIGIKPELKQSDFSNNDEINISEKIFPGKDNIKYYAATLGIKERGIIRGYIAAFVSFDINSIGAANFPEFIKSNLSILNRVIDIKQLKIFQLQDGSIKNVYGDIYPSRDQIKQILNAEVDSIHNDAWIKLKFNNENYATYIFRNLVDDIEYLTTVSVAEKAFSWNLFNFFKIFIIHSLFIVFAFIIIGLSRFNKISISFKSKLLFAFLIISIIPVVVLAMYNTQLVKDRAKESIIKELSQREDYIEKHLLTQLEKNKSKDIITACQSASNELGISFSLYFGTDQVYNSQGNYVTIGFFNNKINSQAYYHLNYLKYREFVIEQSINRFNYDSYYRTIQLNDKDYYLSVNDAFNKVTSSLTTIEINVVIFGIYSFAVIIIIITSTLFANQISQPIQKLTEATEAVSKGDLSVKIAHNEKGEMKDLLDGFNQMTSELKKNQIELAEMEREAAWKEMAKQVAHEIKNPLTPMKLALQQLIISYKDKSKDFDKLFEKVSGTVLNQIDNLNQIASEFSRFAKMPSLKLELVDLIEVLNDTINIFINEKIKIRIQTEINKAPIESDKSQLRRMFINLIRNSIQANANSINIQLLTEDNFYIIYFSDNGEGISKPEKIFDENFTTKKQGMGLGLKLAKRFMENMKGDIKLESTSTEGTTFKIIFPVSE